MADENLTGQLPDELIDAHLGLAYKSSGLNAMTGESWDRIVARRFFALGMATAAGIIEFPPTNAPRRQDAELMLLAAADLESWMKSYHQDGATAETVKRLRDAALGVRASDGDTFSHHTPMGESKP